MLRGVMNEQPALWSDSASVEIAAPPEAVWELVADVTRMGEWSPVCHRCEWTGGARGPEIGARFVGHNRLRGARWSRECEVTAAEPGREFAFRTLFRGRESTRWRYRFEPVDGGTRVTESYEAVSLPPWLKVLYLLPGSRGQALRDGRRNMSESLRRLKAGAEA